MDSRDIKNNVDRRATGATAASTSAAAGGSTGLNNFSYQTTPALTNADICQMCVLLGIQVVCPNDATKRKHTDDHRRAAAAFLSLEDWALPPTEAQIGKCFPQYTPDFFQHQSVVAPTTPQLNNLPQTENINASHQRHEQLPQPRQQIQQIDRSQRGDNEQIQRTVAAILFSAGPSSSGVKPRLSTAESREASISEAVAAVAANACNSQSVPVNANSAVPSKKSRSRSSGSSKKRAKTVASPLKNGDGAGSVVSDVKEQREHFTKSVISAM